MTGCQASCCTVSTAAVHSLQLLQQQHTSGLRYWQGCCMLARYDCFFGIGRQTVIAHCQLRSDARSMHVADVAACYCSARQWPPQLPVHVSAIIVGAALC
jgi:hypothetical protein